MAAYSWPGSASPSFTTSAPPTSAPAEKARRSRRCIIAPWRGGAGRAPPGDGAPFSPMYHRALARRLGLEPPVAVLNIGGVANVTYIDGDDLIACDIGPGKALLHDFVRL